MHSFFYFIRVYFLILILNPTEVLAQNLKSTDALSTSLHELQFKADLKDGFHFNEKAPQQIKFETSTIKPDQLTKKHIEFKIPSLQTPGTASLYVCDDANTFCETHKVKLQPEKVLSLKSTHEIHPLLKSAIKTAKNEHKLILLRFTARWCPGCVRYETEVLNTNEFKQFSKNFIISKVDVDLFKNTSLSEQFKISGIPCLVFLDSNGQEIDRIVDFLEISKLKEVFLAVENNPIPATEILKKTNNGANNLILGKRLLATNHPDEAIEYLKTVQTTPSELLDAEIQSARMHFEKDSSLKEKYLSVLKHALQEESNTSRSLVWRTYLVGSLDEKDPQIETYLSQGKLILENLMNDPIVLNKSMISDNPGELIGYEKLAIMLEYIDLLEAAKKSTDEAFARTAEIGANYNISPLNPGPARRYLSILTNAKKFIEAENFANQILKSDPRNFDVQRRMMKIKLALNKPNEAIKIGEKILSKAEGRNYFWVAEILAKSYLTINEKTKAQKIINATLANADINNPKLKEIKSSLEELNKKVE